MPFTARDLLGSAHHQGKRDKLLRLPIGELSSWQLVAACGPCRSERIIMVFDLVKRFGIDARLVALVPKLRCRQEGCRRAPSHLVLRNRYPAQAGGPGLVEVVLKP